ncbi:type IV pilus biogenesis protein PilM [Snodgrassella communis]|uniref:type IV pilus biogenesis protein PilM n=1 Tax=Snodgrassella communis TaxID=2946699 RepID=UPI00286BCCD8|nr:type IV pilus assembly protein PilM [Snodgrassella communis]WMY92688.1 type IV pilus assembly protein PilM [Snodgrassella communis]
MATTSSGQSLGISITDKSINMVLLNARSLNQFRLEKYVVVPLPKNIIGNGNVENHEELVAHLQQAKQKLQSNCRNITVAISQKQASLQFLNRDEDTEYTEEEQVMAELSQYDSLDDVSYDYQNVSTDNQGRENLLLVNSKREDVNILLDAYTDAGITPTQMDVDILAVMNSAITWINIRQPDLTNKCIAVFNIDYNETQAIIMRHGKLLYKQEINLGYDHLMQSLRRNYQLTEEEAWDMLYNPSKPEDYNSTVAQPFQQQFIQEIQRVLQFYFTSANQESEIDEILIFGYGYNSANGFTDNIRQQTHIPAQQINPILLAQPSNSIEQAKLQQDSSLLTVAFGLAVRGL